MAAWLKCVLNVPVTRVTGQCASDLVRVSLTLTEGKIQLIRREASDGEPTHPGQPAQRVTLPRRSLRDCLAEELRRLHPDPIFEEILTSVRGAYVEAPELRPLRRPVAPLLGCLVVV